MRHPTVGTPSDYADGEDDVPWLLGTQLTTQCGPLARAADGNRVLLVEAHDFARRFPSTTSCEMAALRDRVADLRDEASDENF